MNITQDVITDLLPAYLSGEASADTQALVDEFQREHPQFAAVVQAARRGLGEPLAADQHAIAPDLEREVVRRTRAVISRQRLMLAFAIVLTLMPLSLPSAPTDRFCCATRRGRRCLLPASCLWFVYLRMQRRLKTAGL
jgi:hypothetical protein